METDRGDPSDTGPGAIGGYRLLRPLDGGPLPSGVRRYLGVSPDGGGQAVLTVAAPGPDGAVDVDQRRRLHAAVEIARLTDGPWAVPVLDADLEADEPWMATEYLGGLSVVELVVQGGRLPEVALRFLGSALVSALAPLHAAGRAHGGVGPDAVVLTADGPRLAGWETVRAGAETGDGTGTGEGTGSGAADKGGDEDADGDGAARGAGDGAGGVATAPDDVRGIGTVLAVASGVAAEQEPAPDLSDSLREVLSRCLDDDPGARPTLDEVRRVVDGDVPSGAQQNSGEQDGRRRTGSSALDISAPDVAAVQRPELTAKEWYRLLPSPVRALVTRPTGGPAAPVTTVPAEVPAGQSAVSDPPPAQPPPAPDEYPLPPPVVPAQPITPPAAAPPVSAAPPSPGAPVAPAGSAGTAEAGNVHTGSAHTAHGGDAPGGRVPSYVTDPRTGHSAAPLHDDDAQPTSYYLPPPQQPQEPQPSRSGEAAQQADGGTESAGRPSRRALLTATGAGVVGLLTGAAAVGGWVVGRGGGAEALMAPYPVNEDSADDADRLQLFESAEGAPPAALWRYDASVSVGFVPSVWNDHVLLLAGSHGVLGVDVGTGEELWSNTEVMLYLPLGEPFWLAPHGDLALANNWSALTALEPETGSERWTEYRYRHGEPDYFGHGLEQIEWSLAEAQVVVLRTNRVTDSASGIGIAVYDTERQEERWHRPLPGARVGSFYYLSESETLMVVISQEDGEREVIECRLSDGEVLRRAPFPVSADVTIGFVGAREEFLTLDDNELGTIDAGSLEVLWSEPLGSADEPLRNARTLVIEWDGEERDVLFAIQGNYTAWALDAQDGSELWQRQFRSAELDPGTALYLHRSGDALLIGTDTELTALQPSSGDVLWSFVKAESYLSYDGYRAVPAGEVTVVWDGETAFGIPRDEAADDA